MNKRFIKIGYGDGYAIRDNQTNGLPQIRVQYSDEACFLCDFLNKQDERINELETKNRNAEHLINILEENKLENIGSSLQLFTENAKLKVKINELEEMVTDE